MYDSINYLNSIKIKINVPMLRLVMEEWGKEESILFKGYNKYKEIYNEDSSIIKKDK